MYSIVYGVWLGEDLFIDVPSEGFLYCFEVLLVFGVPNAPGRVCSILYGCGTTEGYILCI